MGGISIDGDGFSGDDQVALNKAVQNRVDYTKTDPNAVNDSMGTRTEYGAPVNKQGNFVAPSESLPSDEYQSQSKAYQKWKSDYQNRWPSATFNSDGSANSGAKPLGSSITSMGYSKGGKASSSKKSGW
jgi:hypothetical protein